MIVKVVELTEEGDTGALRHGMDQGLSRSASSAASIVFT
jgi:hypothetical protein